MTDTREQSVFFKAAANRLEELKATIGKYLQL